MGNFLGLGKKDDLTLDFSGLRTENISTTIPYMNRLNNDARSLVERLNTKNYVPAQNQVFTETENYDMYKLFEKTQDLNNDNTFSDTSPFISSDVYKNLVDKQTGGGKKYRGEEEKDSSSSNSSSDKSSSDSASGSDSESPKKSKKESKDKSKDSDMSGGDDSYVSSSAHTEGVESSVASSKASSASPSAVSSIVSSSVKNSSRKQRSRVLADSINTSDINMISVEE
jgi:hypothetical protein